MRLPEAKDSAQRHFGGGSTRSRPSLFFHSPELGLRLRPAPLLRAFSPQSKILLRPLLFLQFVNADVSTPAPHQNLLRLDQSSLSAQPHQFVAPDGSRRKI